MGPDANVEKAAQVILVLQPGSGMWASLGSVSDLCSGLFSSRPSHWPGPIRQRTSSSLCLGGNLLIPSRPCHELFLLSTATLSEGIVYTCDSTFLCLDTPLNKSEKPCSPSHSFKLISDSNHPSPPLHSSHLPVRLSFPSPLPPSAQTHSSSTLCRTISDA